jgi:hypothetical protein
MKLSKFQKFFTSLFVLAAAAILFTGCSNVSKSTTDSGNTVVQNLNADFIPYRNITDLINESIIIVSGKVLNVDPTVKVPIKFEFPDTVSEAEREKLENSEEGYHMCTVSEVEVSKVIKGDLKEGEIIKIYQLGSSSNEKITKENEIDYFKPGEKHVFFVTDWNGKYTVSPFQGNIKLVNKKSKVNKNNKLFKDGIPEEKLMIKIKGYVEKAKSVQK